MEPFLKQVAHRIAEENPQGMDGVAVVFNNWRSGLFLRQQFAQMEKPSFFLPQILGIDDLVSQLSDLQIIPHEFLMFELFKIHCKLQEAEAEGGEQPRFEDFMSLAEMMLSDFSEIDLYLVDASQLFGNLHDIKEIGEWDVTGTPRTEFQDRYLRFYKSLYTYYTQLRSSLFAQNKGYSGMAYREVAEHIETLADNLPYKHIYFVGFNVLSRCEFKIINQCVKQGKASFITDGDAYYYNNKEQEAGLFLRKDKEHFSEIGDYPNHFAQEEKNITFVSCPTDIVQAKYAGSLIKEISQTKSAGDTLKKTALVLADEGLLLPVLNSLPEEIQAANVTMGFPYELSGVHALVLKLFSLYARAHGAKMYHTDLEDVLSDNLICSLTGIKGVRSKLVKKFSESKTIYSDYARLCEILGEENLSRIEFLLNSIDNTPESFIRHCSDLISALHTTDFIAQNTKESEALASLFQINRYFAELQENYSFVENLATLQKIYSRLAHRHSITFYGEPLSGLQILGMLETRNLDFENIVMLSVNEGVLPSGRSTNSLIPYDLKIDHHLPTHTEKDAVYAYHFYRLLQRAKNIYLLYNAENEGMGKGEPSRFIMQLRHEMAKSYPNIHTEERSVTITPDQLKDQSSAIVEKDENVMKRLKEISRSGFSPSSLTNYLECSLKFFYTNLLGLREKVGIDDDMNSAELGTTIHNVLEKIYNCDAEGNRLDDRHAIDAETLQSHLDNLENILQDVLKNDTLRERSEEGRNALSINIARLQLTHFLQAEIQRLREGNTLEMLLSEKFLERALDIPVGEESWQVKVHGKADRIDYTGECVRIVDYKTGSAKESDLTFSQTKSDSDETAPVDLSKIPGKWLQVMTYAWLYHNTPDSIDAPVASGLFALRNMGSDFMPAQFNGTMQFGNASLEDFESILSAILKDILDPTKPFAPKKSPNAKNCPYCPFLDTCSKSAVKEDSEQA